MATAKNKALEDIKRDLFSGNDATVMKALSKSRDEGNASLVEPLIALYITTKSKLIESEVADMLNNLKVSGTEDAFIAALSNAEYKSRRGEIVAFMWNSGIQPIEYMDVITKVALEGPFNTTLECLTLLESMDELIPEEQLLESIASVREYLNENPATDLKPLIVDYLGLLERHEAMDGLGQ